MTDGADQQIKMSTGKGFTEEQKDLFERSGAKNDWKIGLFFMIVFLAVIGINILCRYGDNHKLEKLEHTEGIVASSESHDEWIGRKRHIENSIIVRYTPEGSDKEFSFYDSDGPYEFMHPGEVLRVYYEENDPEEAYIAKMDWIIRKYVRADINYETAFIISIFPLGIGLFFFAEELTVRKNIKKGKFKVKKSDGIYEDENLHELARMSNAKRSWSAAWVGLSLLYIFFMFMGIAWVVIALTSKDGGNKGYLIGGIVVILLAQGCPLGIFLTMRFIFRRKRSFIKGFMEDDATKIYNERWKAANVLWKHVKHFMEAESFMSRYKYDYSRVWLEKFEDKIEKFRGNEPENL